MNEFPKTPETIADEESLLDWMTCPDAALIESVAKIEGPLVVVGAGGKMGPSLCVQAKRAAQMSGRDLAVIALSRFSNPAERAWLEARGVRTQVYDALDENASAALPDASHVVYLVGLKFGTGSNPELTWATNTIAPSHVAQRYRGIPMVALSTGNVYPLVDADSSGANEETPLTPLGEYANAAVARERVFSYFSKAKGIPLALLRLNYALDLRYGILVDLGTALLEGRPIDLSMSRLNCIWQRDANARILRSLELVEQPAVPFNLTSLKTYEVRDLAEQLGRHLGIEPQFVGEPAETALLSDASKLGALLGPPETSIVDVVRLTAQWLKQGGRTLGKPTKFQVRDGAF